MQGVVAGGACMFSLYGQPRTQAAASAPDYTAEASEVLAELDSLLAAAGSGRNLVVKVRACRRLLLSGVSAALAAARDRLLLAGAAGGGAPAQHGRRGAGVYGRMERLGAPRVTAGACARC